MLAHNPDGRASSHDAHCLSDSSNVGVVPRVVVDERRSVGHAADLVAVVPPRHDLGVVRRVLPEPVVGLLMIVNNGVGFHQNLLAARTTDGEE